MENRVDIKRKHTRFPAYDDETGVKIARKDRVPIFKDTEPLITSTHYSDHSMDEQRSLRRHTRVSQERAGHTPQQQRELEKHRANLPDYGKSYHRIAKASPTGKRNLFGETTSRTSYIVRRKDNTPRAEYEVPYVDKQEPLLDESSPELNVSTDVKRTRFVPSYVPASVIPDKEDKDVSKEELMAAVKKDANSYLLFDTEPAAYQVKEREEDPSIQKFYGDEKTSVKMTRSEYKKIGKKKGLFDPKDSSKKTILERSLSGLIEEEDSSDLDNNGYFTKE